MMTETMTDSVCLKNVSIGYPGMKALLSDVNANVLHGEMVALVGRNGSGKTTLLKTMAGLHSHFEGSVHILGNHISSYTAVSFAEKVSFAGTMKHVAENLTVFELVSTARFPYTNWWGTLKTSDRKKIVNAVRFVGMEEHLQTKIDRLSDGERQRVLIATALAQDTRIILLDEPTAFLDIPNRIGIADVLHHLARKGKTVLFSTHDTESAFSYADRLWLIHNGSLIQGAPEDLGLKKAFEEAFIDEDVVFDDSNLRFRKRPAQLHNAILDVKDPWEYEWTRRAVERSGFHILNNTDKKAFDIRVEKNPGSDEWNIGYRNTTVAVSSLYEMVKYLKTVL